MKKYLIISFLLAFQMISWGQEKIIFKMTQPIESDEMVFEDDSVRIHFSRTYNGALYFTVNNKTSGRIYIEWENARFDSDRIVFGDDSRLSMRNVKADEMITKGGESSYHKGMYKESWISSDSIWNRFSDDRIEDYGEYNVKVIVPIRFSNGNTEDYQFRIIGYHYDPVDYSGIELGMKTSQVQKLLGKPNEKDKYKDRPELWDYHGCVKITFEKGFVTKIEPFDYNK